MPRRGNNVNDRVVSVDFFSTLFKCLIVCMNLYPNPWDLINNDQRYRQVMLSSKSRADQFKKEPVTPFWSTPGRGKRILGQWVT